MTFTRFGKIAAAGLLFAFATLYQSNSAFAQANAFLQGKKDKGPSERSVTGVVSDDSGKAMAGAVVQLKNTKTLQIRSFISKDNGEFFFNGLNTDTDYELTAKSGEMVSPKRVVSSFDSRKQAIVNLTVK